MRELSLRSPTPAERDVLGLGLIAVGVFLGFVLYGGWNGGRAGHGLAVALGWTLGKARALAPIALIAAGGALLLRGVLPAVGRLRAGAVCLFASLTLALAAGTLRGGPGPGGKQASWASPFLPAPRGGGGGGRLHGGPPL